MRTFLLICAVGAMLLLPGTAAGDAVYHSQHVDLHPVAGAPLHSGFVENIHPNGPNVYAHEVYVLSGVQSGTSYQVVLLLFPFSTSCGVEPLAIPTATLTTNGHGNGEADAFFHPADIPTRVARRGPRSHLAVVERRRGRLRDQLLCGNARLTNGGGADVHEAGAPPLLLRAAEAGDQGVGRLPVGRARGR